MSKTLGLKLALAVALAMFAAACSTPSQLYGLAPPHTYSAAYPNINVDPALKSQEKVLTPKQRAEAEAELQRRASGKAKAK